MSKMNNVYDELCDIRNIAHAGTRASKDKKYQKDVVKYRNNQLEYDRALSEALRNKTYTITEDDYICFEKVTSSGKVRQIKKLAFYPHRIVQHAVLNIVEERWVKSLTYDSYNCIKGRGINSKDKKHNFTSKLKRALQDPYCAYVLKMDIEQFYHTINNRKMSKEYRKDIKDKNLLWLLDKLNYSTNNLPIGGPDSQIRSHLVLRRLDRFIKETLKARYYFRYADDMVILSDSKQELHLWQWRIMNFLYYELRLRIKGNRTIFPVVEGTDVCGYVFRPKGTRLRKRIKKNIIKKRNKPKSVASYNGILKHCNSKNLQELVIKRNNIHMDMSSVNIKIERRFAGKEVKIAAVTDQPISILDFEVRPSTQNKDGLWVMMQILYRNEKRFMKGGYTFICEWLKKFEETYIGDITKMTASEYKAKKDSVLPLTNVVIQEFENGKGYYFEGTTE